MTQGAEPVPYRRERFETVLPADRLYVPSHFWLAREASGTWRVGFTPFATRMLGEPVEHQFTIPAGATVRLGDVVGWVEGFKAVTELYAVVEGVFGGGNPGLDEDITRLQADPFGTGWLYRVTGTPAPDMLDAHGYATHLDATIEKLQDPKEGKPER